MLRVSILAIAAVALAACDDEAETTAVEGETDVAVVEEEATEETEVATAEEEPAAEPAAPEEADLAEAEPEAGAEEAATAEGELAEGEATELEAEEVTVLTDEDPAVETEVITDPGAEQQGTAAAGTEQQDTTAAAEGDEQVAMAREGDMSEAMQAYEDWAVGRWGADGSCEADAVVLQENSMSLPGGVSCDDVQVSSAGQDSLSVTGMSCEGAGTDQVELEVTQADDGLTVSRDGQQTQVTRCP